MCARAYSGSVRRSECWENPALPGSVSARGIVRPAICFVKPQTTTCSAFLLGQAQDVDFHCTGFWLWALGFRPVQADAGPGGPEGPPLRTVETGSCFGYVEADLQVRLALTVHLSMASEPYAPHQLPPRYTAMSCTLPSPLSLAVRSAVKN